MTSFLIALATLIVGYIIYGAIAERVFGVDPSRKMPAETTRDDVDFMPLP
ncbi:MAG: carbon starvation protein A, partial [Muribaculaceae bacterium]|nr:carbon starvation protein A [Muribaculaceae bacterium]